MFVWLCLAKILSPQPLTCGDVLAAKSVAEILRKKKGSDFEGMFTSWRATRLRRSQPLQ